MEGDTKVKAASVMEGDTKDRAENVVYTKSNLVTYEFMETIGGTQVAFSVLKMRDSLFLWIGLASDPRLMNMSVALQSPYDSLPLTSQILGSQSEDTSTGFASRLSRKLNKPVYVSVNVPIKRFLMPEVVKRLNQEVTNNPQYF